jgi:opacity protein-like surface antigen
VIGHTVPLHGRNDTRDATADGRYFWFTGLTANVWPEYELDDRWSLYGGGGLGPGVVTAFGSSSTTWMALGGGGVRYRLTDDLSADVGGRYYWTAPTRVNGAQSRYDSFGPSFRLTWDF